MQHGIGLGSLGLAFFGVIALTACSESPADPTAAEDTTEPVLPDNGDQRPAPLPASKAPRPRHPLADVASIVAADVASVSEEFDDRLGPRRVYALENLEVYAGREPSTHSFSQLGGTLPDGNYVGVLDQPDFEAGKRYVFFFAQKASLDTPVWGDLSFEVERYEGRDFVVSRTGHAVLGFATNGVEEGTTDLHAAEATERKLTIEAAVQEPKQGTMGASGNPDDDPPLSHENVTAHQLAEGRAIAQDSIVLTEAERTRGLTPQRFGEAARAAALEVGAPIGEDFSLDPPADARWNASKHTAKNRR